jgi:hypothetical protein
MPLSLIIGLVSLVPVAISAFFIIRKYLIGKRAETLSIQLGSKGRVGSKGQVLRLHPEDPKDAELILQSWLQSREEPGGASAAEKPTEGSRQARPYRRNSPSLPREDADLNDIWLSNSMPVDRRPLPEPHFGEESEDQ